MLAASFVFYMAFIPAYVLILCLLIFIDYVAGLQIESASGARRKRLLGLSLLANLGVLTVFKYGDFFLVNASYLGSLLGATGEPWTLGMVLPIGLSFHTFQAMSYTIEVYRGRVAAERSLLNYSLYVMIYPQLVAGPIERPQNLLPQFRERHEIDYARITSGLKQMAWGFFKKVVVADRCALLVSAVYVRPDRFSGLALAVATVLFAFQIYGDFSGYSDIAIGAARVMGFRLMKNFNNPYGAHSVSEFWKRWHISLSTWFRDYVYIPLGGSRVPLAKQGRNVWIVFLLSGFWHGANWTFVAWGALHATYLTLELLLRSRLPKLPRWSGRLWTFVSVCIAWIFFRAESLSVSLKIIGKLHTGWSTLWLPGSLSQRLGLQEVAYIQNSEWFLLFLMIGVLLLAESYGSEGWLNHQRWWVRWSLYYLLLCAVLFFGEYHAAPFIYFQF